MCKKIFSVMIAFILVFTSIVGRVAFVVFSGNYLVSNSYNSFSLTIANNKATIYDKNIKPLTNSSTSYVAVIRPNEKCLNELNLLFNENEIKEIKEELKKGYPIIRNTGFYRNTKYIKLFVKKDRYSNNQICNHVISKYSNGIENRYSNKLDIESSLKINYSVDAKGRLLSGDEGEFILNNYNSKEGISLTIDKEIQKVVESSLDFKGGVSKGGAIVLDVETGAILALASRPNFDIKNPNDIGNDYVNRVFSPYAIGSVFKIIVAACAIENNIEIDYTCEGKITVGDTDYSCLNGKIHKKQSMKTALSNSCNCYFVKLALEIGADKLYDFSKNLLIGQKIEIAKDWTTNGGNLPSKETLEMFKGELALLGFGQGSVTATPLQIASVLQAVANDGEMKSPYLINGNVNKDGVLINKNISYLSKRVMSKQTAKKIQEYLRFVVTEGSASLAESNDKKSACKTSTAQSGTFFNDNEILRTWVAGFYPYDKPKYAIVIINENGISGSVSCCPIFKSIVDNIE